jgi:hypothetical protein
MTAVVPFVQAQSSDFTQGVTSLSSTQARIWWKPSGYTAGYVISHYLINNTNQQNVNMAYNSSSAQWELTVSGLSSGAQLTYSFTYQKNGVQLDSQWFVYTQGSGGATATPTSSSCTPTAITPYLQVNGGAWQQATSATVSAGSSVMFGPQPTSGGSWQWSNGATTREITVTVNATSSYTATYTNASGCKSTQTFTISVAGSQPTATPTSSVTATPTNGGCTPTTIVPYLQVNGGAWQQVAGAAVAAGSTVKFGPQPTSGGSWLWSNGATTREITVTVNASTTYTVTYTNASGCKSTQAFTLSVGPTPTATVAATPTSGTTPTPAPGQPGATHPRLKINNGCGSQTMWLQWLPGNNGGTLNAANHVAIGAGGSMTLNIPDAGLAGLRVWPSYGCDASGNNCTIGASGGPAANGFTCPANIGCAPPVDTKWEGTFGCIPPLSGSQCQQNPSAPGTSLGAGDWWDSSFVDGFTVPSKVVVHGNCPVGPQPAPVYGPGGPPGGQIDCSGLRLSSCPRSENLSTNGQFSSSPGSPGGTTLANQDLLLRHPNADGSYSSTAVGCFSPSSKLTSGQWQAIPKPPFTGTFYQPADAQAQMYTCPSPPVTPAQCSAGPAATTNYTKYIHSVCSSYAYAYDDTFGLASCPAAANLQYEVTFYCPQ